MRSSVIVLALLAACPGIVRGQDPFESMRKGKEYRAGYREGQAEADREFRDQRPTLYTAGLRESWFDNLDRETGLPYCNFGCVVDDRLMGRVEGHNDQIRESIKAHGLPKGSFKPWEKELFGLRAYVESRRKREKPESLTIDGPARKSPDGSCTVRIVLREDERPDGKITKSPWLEIRGEGRKPEVVILAGAGDTFKLFWGPKESGFAVLAWRHSETDLFEAVDLQRGGSLRVEQVSPPAGISDNGPRNQPGGR